MGALLREEFWTVVLLLADIGDAVEGVAGSQSLFDEDLKSIRLGKKSKASFFKSEKSNALDIQFTTRITVTRITNPTRTTDKRPTTTSCMK